MELPESDIHALVWALMDEALEEEESDTCYDSDEISIGHLKRAFMKHDGLVENLSIR